MINFLREKQKKQNLEDTINELYFNSILDVRQTPEYISNKFLLDAIKTLLYEDMYTPDLVALLVETLHEQIAMEYEYANKNIIDYIKKIVN